MSARDTEIAPASTVPDDGRDLASFEEAHGVARGRELPAASGTWPEGIDDAAQPAPSINGGQVFAQADASVYAALDLGTNNCRLLIARASPDGFRVIDAFSRIVRLGEGLAITGRLSDAAIARAIEALKICRVKLDTRGAGRVRMIATEASRAATNGMEFIERVRAEASISLEVIDREREARLAAAGCIALSDPRARGVILFDIGGGSSEIVWVRQYRNRDGAIVKDVRAWVSLPLGVVSLADRHGGIVVTPEIFDGMVAEVAAELAPFAMRASEAANAQGFHLLGTSGTVTTIAGIHLGLSRYDRRRVDGMWMSADDTAVVMKKLLAMSYSERAANGCIGAERADLVLAGCAIFEAIRRAFPAERVRIADRGLREGLLMEMMQEDNAWRDFARKPV